MASGNNHAKRIVIDEATKLAEKLENGDSGCVKTQGRAISLLIKMITPLYMAEFVTIKECQEMHDKSKKVKAVRITRLKIGPVQIEGPIIATLLANSMPFACCGALVFIIGKLQNWW